MFAKIDVVLFKFHLSFPASPDRFVLTFLDVKLLVQRVDLSLQRITFSPELIHLLACSVPVLLHFLLNGANLVHMVIDFGLLASQLLFQLVNWEITGFSSSSAQSFDLFLDLRHVDSLLHLLVGFTLSLDGSDGVRHDHVEVEDDLVDHLILFGHEQKYIARFLAKGVCSEIQTFDSRNKFEAFQQKLTSLIT